MHLWQKIQKELGRPIMMLAPLADVTDPAFRRVIARYGKPDVMWTEFVSADGLFFSPVGEYCEKFIRGEISREELYATISAGVGGSTLLADLAYAESERPIIAQFFTSRPEMMRKAAALARVLGFDGVDINMGCPDKSVEKQGAGAALIRNPKLAQEIIAAAKDGAGELPVSVKTRLGYNRDELDTWLPSLLEAKPAAVTIHARTRKEMSLVPARWERIKRAVEIRDEAKSDTLIFGNGDALDLGDAERKASETGADGVMLGRAIFGNPWCFNRSLSREEVPIPDRLRVLVEHTRLFEELLPHKSFAVMKKHYKAYVSGWDGAKELRMRLMDAPDAKGVAKIVEEYLHSISQLI